MADEQMSESVETVDTGAEVAEAAETPVETVQSSEDVWNTPLNLTAEEAETTTEGEEKESESIPDAPEADEKSTETPEETEEDEPEEETLELNADKPAPLSRRKLREAEGKVITPFRDPDAPIEDVWRGLSDLNPQRAEELATRIVEESASKYPDLWLQTITGLEGVTVEAIKQKFSGVEPTQVDDSLQTAVDHLNQYYGEDWKDPSKDADLLDEDRVYVQAIRKTLDTGVHSEKDAKIRELEQKLSSLEPEIQGIKSQQEAEFEQRITQAKESAVTEYQTSIEKRSLPSLFEQSGLKITESDTPNVKSVKEYIQAQFKTQGEFMSPFEQFAVTQFSDRENLAKIIGRVDKYLDEATKAELKASQTKDKAKASELQRLAAARKSDAKAEADRLTVLHKKASQEYLKTIPLMSILEENADLQRRLGLRKEIVGNSSVAANTKAWADGLDKDPWSNEVSIVDRASSMNR